MALTTMYWFLACGAMQSAKFYKLSEKNTASFFGVEDVGNTCIYLTEG
jgi:hypothetical protein